MFLDDLGEEMTDAELSKEEEPLDIAPEVQEETEQ